MFVCKLQGNIHFLSPLFYCTAVSYYSAILLISCSDFSLLILFVTCVNKTDVITERTIITSMQLILQVNADQ